MEGQTNSCHVYFQGISVSEFFIFFQGYIHSIMGGGGGRGVSLKLFRIFLDHVTVFSSSPLQHLR